MQFKSTLLALLAMPILGAFAEDASPPPGDEATQEPPANAAPIVKADFEVTFPEADIFGVKLVNGRPTSAVVDVTNHEDGPISVEFIGGVLASKKPLPPDAPPQAHVIRNLTAMSYGVVIEPGEKKSLPYSFVLDMNPQDVEVKIVAVVSNADSAIFQVQIGSSDASIVEAPMSIFDPQIIFLYLVLSGAFGATLYFVYKTWIEALFPQAKRSKKSKKVEAEAVSTEATGFSTATGKDYDESWIPQSHINRPNAKRAKGKAKGSE